MLFRKYFDSMIGEIFSVFRFLISPFAEICNVWSMLVDNLLSAFDLRDFCFNYVAFISLAENEPLYEHGLSDLVHSDVRARTVYVARGGANYTDTRR